MKTNYANTSMPDMVFENRNQAYGAYVLRQQQDKYLLQGLFFTLTAVSLLLLYNFLHDKFQHKSGKGPVEIIADIAEINVTPPAPQIKPETPPPSPQQQQPQAQATVADAERRVVQDNQAQQDSIPDTRDLENVESGLTTNLNVSTGGLGVTDGTGTGGSLEPAQPAAPEIDNSVHDFSEIQPEFPGGEEKLKQFLIHHTEYPSFERESDIQGKVYVKFVVNQDGSVSNAEIIRSDTRGFSNEAMRVVSLLPKFKPGTQQGKPVRVRMVLPFYFKLNN